MYSRFFALLWILICFSLPAGCRQEKNVPVIRGDLTGNIVWSGLVQIAGDVILTDGSSLVIQPGTRIQFLPSEADSNTFVEHPYFPASELIVRGRLLAIGTAEQPIVFESADPMSGPGAWGAINVEGSPEAVFEYCHFLQADSAVHSRDSQVYIEQSLFEDNQVGIRFHSSQILIENNLLRNNQTAIRFHFDAPVICNNRFETNGINLFITSYPKDYRIENNQFGKPREYQVVLGEEVPDDVHMANNYWDGLNADQVHAQIYDGQRSEYLGRVIVEPMMTSPPRHNGFTWTQ
ncbi:MAG: right-handed parallel beta-helix repeat-containing protein [Deltaproteobacteria bacterium]|jgi:hypothetical protein|nr:right-handed parallel beta-helix repeat-containing protein [Deltaproteobacteria bacterium]